jgi:putative SOS response-associated peptidase YedK
MCGRYTATTSSQPALADRFGLGSGDVVPREGIGRANVCPTEPVLAVVGGEDGSRGARLLRWGLAPTWSTLKGARPLINARDDKLRTGGAWRRLAETARHRCLVVADGWLEWQRAEDRRQPRQPFLHGLPGRPPFAFAGLWCAERPRDGDGPVASCTIITVTANREASVLHDRMPAVLGGPAEEAAWLDPHVDLEGALELIRPLPDGTLEIMPVSKRLNRSGVEGLDLLDPESPDPRQTQLL